MNGLGTIKVVMGLCIASVAGSAWADGNAFVGRWHWNRTQSTPPAGEPVPNDVAAEISRVDSTHVQWSLTVLASQGQTSVETFDAVPNGEFYPINSDTTAAFRLVGNTLQATFKGPTGQTDTLTCTLSADQKKMTCQGVLSSGEGRTTTYVDVYDRM
jgi:hypothetical protein